ncbi:MAG: TolC family protein [Porticoccaceae bacterium]|nr:TolC family protein [Porticoccaceae bacterium]
MKNNKSKVAVAAFLVTLAASTTSARPLVEELQSVLTLNPNIKAGALSVEAAQARTQVADAGFYPRLIINADTGLENIKTTSFKPSTGTMELGNDGVVTPATNSELTRRKLGLSLEQPLYSGGRLQANANIADADLRIKELSLQSVTQDVLLEAVTNYLQVGRYQTLIGLARLNEETTRSQLDNESKRVQGGGGVAVDVLQARTRLQVVKERSVFYEQGLRDAIASYEQTFGREPDLARFEEVGIYQSGLPKDMAIAMQKGLEANPRLQVARLQVDRAQEQIALAKSGALPTVDAVLSGNIDRNANATARRDDYSAFVRLNWNFSLGMEAKHRAAASLRDKDELGEKEVAARGKLRENIRISWNLLINGKERLDLLDSAASIARDVMISRKRLRDAGKETALSALDAEVEYYGVLANKINAMYDMRIGSYRLLAAVGALTPEALGIGGSFKLPVQPLLVDLETIARPGTH